jgi:NADH-quinone oxidoreductase subunit J
MTFFLILAAVAIVSAILTISAKNPVKSAVALICNFFVLAGLYLSLNAQFLAVSQIIVYAGAIMVLIVFVIMLLNIGHDTAIVKKVMKNPVLGYAISLLLALGLIASITISASKMKMLPPQTSEIGSAAQIGQLMYNDYIVGVIAIGVLLTAAILGAMKLAKKNA